MRSINSRLVCLFGIGVLLMSCYAVSCDAAPKSGVSWEEGWIYATGNAVPPESSETDAQKKLLAKRGAMVDLQRNLLEFIKGVRVDSKTEMRDFIATDYVRTTVEGTIKGVEVLEATWDGEVYTVMGRVPMSGIRKAAAPMIPSLQERKIQPYTGEGKEFLVIDARHLDLKPALACNVATPGGEKVYGPEFADRNAFIDKGLCRYVGMEPVAFAPEWIALFAATPAFADDLAATIPDNALTVRAVAAGGDQSVDLVISEDDAARVRSNSFDYRAPCNVIVLTRTTSIRGRLDGMERVVASAAFSRR